MRLLTTFPKSVFLGCMACQVLSKVLLYAATPFLHKSQILQLYTPDWTIQVMLRSIIESVPQERNSILMQKQENRASKSHTHALMKMLRALPQITRFIRSKPSTEQFQHAKEALITNLRNDGGPEGVLRFFEAIIETLATAAHEIQEDQETYYYKIDLYLVGGMGIVSLVLLQVLASVGHPDLASSISWLTFAIAFPYTAGFLLLGFLKKEYRASGYGSIPEKIAFIAELAGFISIAALIWHFWFLAGIVFLPFAIVLFMFCSFYKLIIVFMKHWKPLPIPEPDEASEKQPEGN